jgi:hypothetical protein
VTQYKACVTTAVEVAMECHVARNWLITTLMPASWQLKPHSTGQRNTIRQQQERLSKALQAIREATSHWLQPAKQTKASWCGPTTPQSQYPQSRHKKRSPHHNPDNLRFLRSIRDKINAAIRGGWAPSTLKGYNGAVAQFLAFCNKEKAPVKYRFPTSETVLCAFTASGLG